ncbi:UDP-glycosyltransferase 75D1 [Acorus calamus]|uniref:UDP-glycosyltransferase 75D1 n=1 Tax=Acorus calamus TaxID=4465 RepID=A0AAV9EYV6_ACOCL|nr:UDP-glycosyltransferase 75D1 [Acorus calamus]
MEWMDLKLPCSVVYVLFGTKAMLQEKQMEEISKGLELGRRDFLWVVNKNILRQDRNVIDVFPGKETEGEIKGEKNYMIFLEEFFGEDDDGAEVKSKGGGGVTKMRASVHVCDD